MKYHPPETRVGGIRIAGASAEGATCKYALQAANQYFIIKYTDLDLGRTDIVRQHDKIINMAAKKILAPQGLFRQGTSRTWLDDNGYFIIFVVFDSSNWSRGSYLGVGIDFFGKNFKQRWRNLLKKACEK